MQVVLVVYSVNNNLTTVLLDLLKTPRSAPSKAAVSYKRSDWFYLEDNKSKPYNMLLSSVIHLFDIITCLTVTVSFPRESVPTLFGSFLFSHID